MAYEKIVKELKEYAGESFAESILKEGRSLWKSNEIATYSMYDESGAVSGITGSLTISSDRKSIGFMISKTDTVGLIGPHKVMVELGDSNDANMSDVIAEYNIEYIERKA